MAPESPASLSEVDQTGSVVAQGLGLVGEKAVTGIAGGVAYDTAHGVALWSLAKQGVVRGFGGPLARVLGASGNLVAWCDSSCAELHLSSVTGDDRVVPVPKGEASFESDAAFSPDGRLLVILAGGPATGPGLLVLVDAQAGTTRWVGQQAMPGGASLAWSPDGTRVFASWRSPTQVQTTVVEYHVASNRAKVATLPVAPDRGAMLAVSEARAPILLAEHLALPQVCQEPPSTSPQVCGFRF